MKVIDVTVALKLLEICIVYGVPAVQTVLKNWNKETITLEDIDNLEVLVKKPEQYF